MHGLLMCDDPFSQDQPSDARLDPPMDNDFLCYLSRYGLVSVFALAWLPVFVLGEAVTKKRVSD